MSADNYAICPKCAAGQNNWKLVMGEPLDDGDHTLREDYEQGILDGSYYVDYHARCSACGFTFSFHHEEKVKL